MKAELLKAEKEKSKVKTIKLIFLLKKTYLNYCQRIFMEV